MKLNVVGQALSLVGCVVLLNSAMSSYARAACQIKVVADLPLQPNPSRALVQGAVNGKPVVFILDTGAWASSIPYPDAVKLGVRMDNSTQFTSEGIGGDVHTAIAHFDMKLGKATLPNEIMTVLNMHSLDNNAVALIGRELIEQQDLELDLPDNDVRIEKITGCAAAQLAYWNKPYSQVRLESDGSDHPAILLKVLLNGHAVLAEIDSGAPRSIVTPGAAMTAGANLGKAASEGDLGGIGSRRLAASVVTFDTFTIGDETIKNAKLTVSDMWRYNDQEETGTRLGSLGRDAETPRMLLGADFLRAHHAIVDNTMKLMVFSYVGGPVFDISQPKANGIAPDGSALFQISPGVTITGLRHPLTPSPPTQGAPPRLAYYPPAAQSKGLTGEATVQCDIKIGGLLNRCSIVSETPIGEGFGEKAVLIGSILNLHNLEPSMDWTQVTEGAQARVPIHFVLKDNPK